MKEKELPPEVRLYGRSKFEDGYSKGYFQRIYDMRRIRDDRARSLKKRFGKFWDYIDDMIASNKKK